MARDILENNNSLLRAANMKQNAFESQTFGTSEISPGFQATPGVASHIYIAENPKGPG